MFQPSLRKRQSWDHPPQLGGNFMATIWKDPSHSCKHLWGFKSWVPHQRCWAHLFNKAIQRLQITSVQCTTWRRWQCRYMSWNNRTSSYLAMIFVLAHQGYLPGTRKKKSHPQVHWWLVPGLSICLLVLSIYFHPFHEVHGATLSPSLVHAYCNSIGMLSQPAFSFPRRIRFRKKYTRNDMSAYNHI